MNFKSQVCCDACVMGLTAHFKTHLGQFFKICRLYFIINKTNTA